MSNLQLHAKGRTEHHKTLRDILLQKIKEVRQNKNLSDAMKQELIAKAENEYSQAAKNTLNNLY